MPEKNDPIIIENGGMRMTVAYRKGLGGEDEGLTFDITVADGESAGKRILRFDCFKKTPHYHVGASGKNSVHNMADEGITDPIGWSLAQLKGRLNAMISEAGYQDIASAVDQKIVADQLNRLEPDIRAKV
jgi:hypothetical protein